MLQQKQHKIEDESPGEKFFRWSRKSIVDPTTCTYKQNKIQLDKEEEEEKTFKKMKELHSDCSLYERWLRDFLSTYVLEIVRANVYLYDVSHNKQQQEAIRWYNNWPPPRSIYSIPFSFHIAAPSPPTGPLRRNLNRINQTNFDKMSFTMKSKSLYLPLFLSVCLSISQSLSLFLSLLPVPHLPARPTGLVWPGLIRPFLLLCCAPPTLPPLPLTQ